MVSCFQEMSINYMNSTFFPLCFIRTGGSLGSMAVIFPPLACQKGTSISLFPQQKYCLVWSWWNPRLQSCPALVRDAVPASVPPVFSCAFPVARNRSGHSASGRCRPVTSACHRPGDQHWLLGGGGGLGADPAPQGHAPCCSSPGCGILCSAIASERISCL